MITDDQIKLMIGSLLHDIGKVVYRSGDGRNHSQSGYEYLKNEAHISDDEILNCEISSWNVFKERILSRRR